MDPLTENLNRILDPYGLTSYVDDLEARLGDDARSASEDNLYELTARTLPDVLTIGLRNDGPPAEACLLLDAERVAVGAAPADDWYQSLRTAIAKLGGEDQAMRAWLSFTLTADTDLARFDPVTIVDLVSVEYLDPYDSAFALVAVVVAHATVAAQPDLEPYERFALLAAALSYAESGTVPAELRAETRMRLAEALVDRSTAEHNPALLDTAVEHAERAVADHGEVGTTRALHVRLARGRSRDLEFVAARIPSAALAVDARFAADASVTASRDIPAVVAAVVAMANGAECAVRGPVRDAVRHTLSGLVDRYDAWLDQHGTASR